MYLGGSRPLYRRHGQGREPDADRPADRIRHAGAVHLCSRWVPHDLILWDNRAVLHRATPFQSTTEHRAHGAHYGGRRLAGLVDVPQEPSYTRASASEQRQLGPQRPGWAQSCRRGAAQFVRFPSPPDRRSAGRVGSLEPLILVGRMYSLLASCAGKRPTSRIGQNCLCAQRHHFALGFALFSTCHHMCCPGFQRAGAFGREVVALIHARGPRSLLG